MSINASDAVWNHSQMTGSARVVMLAIAHFADTNGVAWPGIERLADMSKITPRSVQRAIQQCEEAGELAVERAVGRGNTNVFRILLVEKGDISDAKGDVGVSIRGEEKVTPVTEKVTPVTRKGDVGVTRSIIEPLEEPTTAPIAPAAPNGNGRDYDAEYRKVVAVYEQNIAQITPHVSKRIVESLNDFHGSDLVEAIHIAVESNALNWRYVNGVLKRWRTEGRGMKARASPDSMEGKVLSGPDGEFVIEDGRVKRVTSDG